MRKIIVGAQVSLDGVMQSPGGQTEDPVKGFRLGGWSIAYYNPEFGSEIAHLFDREFDLLLGRKTYEIFAAYWPFQSYDAPHGGIAKAFDRANKYVASASGEVETSWKNSVLLRDIDAIRRLRQEDGPPLITQGSTELIHALFAADLVDALSMFVVPVVLGGGKKLFADGSAPHAYKLAGSRIAPNGLMIGHYERDGEVRTSAAFALDKPSDLELARRARMAREN